MSISSPPLRFRALSLATPLLLFCVSLCAPLGAQVHYHADGNPWRQKARSGPDAVVDGWYYNLGVTGIRVQLVEDRPNDLLVKHVFEGSPARGRLRPGDWLIGAGGRPFRTPHVNGYGMDRFGPTGPIRDFATALEESLGEKGRLELAFEREGEKEQVTLDLGPRHGIYAASYPADCEKSARITKELNAYLAEQQREDGSWGNPVHDTFAPLALLASGEKKHRRAVERCARFHARTTKAEDDSSLINWRYMAAAIVLSEYYLATREKWVVAELEEIYAFLLSSQYTDPSQIVDATRRDRPHDLPTESRSALGGWGHNPGFEGYGPICMLTGQGALAFALMKRCGLDIDRERHLAAYDFLARGTGRNGYVWYADEAAGHENWADMGRTGAAGLAHHLSPWQTRENVRFASAHAAVIGAHPESFPDTHGSPILGMGFAALTAHLDPQSFRRLMDANRWWFLLSRCHDGTFYYQPNRDNAGYGGDSRLTASAVTAFVFSIPRRNLVITGKPAR